MSIIELKQKCNQHYSQAIELIENNEKLPIELKNAIIEDYQPLIFDKIKLLLKCEWEKQKKEANLN